MTRLLALIAVFQAGAIAVAQTPLLKWRPARAHVESNQLQGERGAPAAKAAVDTAFDGKTQRLVFDGRGQWLTLAQDTPTLVRSGKLPAATLTIETWARIDRTQPWGAVLSAIQDNGSHERGWMLGVRNDRFCFGLTSLKTKRLTYLSSGQPFASGYWYHLVATYDGKVMRIYVDGKLSAESKAQSGAIAYPAKGRVAIGAYLDDNERYPIQGRIDSVSVFGSALDAAVVRRKFETDKKRFPDAVVQQQRTVKGWPTYQHDEERSGVTTEVVDKTLQLKWVYQCMTPPSPAWPPPAKQDFWHGKAKLSPRVTFDRAYHVVSDGARVFFGTSSDNRVVCLDLRSGKRVWQHFAEGPVRLAPTVLEDRIYFGSDDGQVYCLDAATGKRQWAQRPVGPDRRIPGNGRIISSLPIRTDVLARDGQLRLGAGLFPRQGTFQAVLDAGNGKVLAQGPIGFSPQGYLQRKGNTLMVSAGRAPAQMLARLRDRGKLKPVLATKADRAFAAVGTPKLRFLGRNGEVVAIDATSGQQVWQGELEGKAYALAAVTGHLLVSTDQGVIYCFADNTGGRPATKTVERANAKVDALNTVLIGEMPNAAQGYALVVGAASADRMIHDLLGRTKLRVVCIDPSESLCQQLQQNMFDQGMAHRVTAMAMPFKGSLPFADGIFNVLCVEGSCPLPPREVRRILRPRTGVAVVLEDKQGSTASTWKMVLGSRHVQQQANRIVFRRPALERVGSWTHMYANPANTVCSDDERVGGDLRLQWFGGPGPRDMLDRHHRTTPPLSAGGRMFVPADNLIVAVDAYNGTPLWRHRLQEFRRVGALRDSGNMVATVDSVYALTGDTCVRLDARTGKSLARWRTADVWGEDEGDWGYVAVDKGLLYGTVTRKGASRTGHSRQQINETYYDGVAIVTSRGLFCLDRLTGQRAWSYKPRGGIVNPTITIGDGRVYFVESQNAKTLSSKSGRSPLKDLLASGADLVALDAQSGKLLWRRPANSRDVEHHLFLCYAKGKLISIGTRNRREPDGKAYVWYDVSCFDARTGRPQWKKSQNQRQRSGGSHGEQDHHPVVVGDTVYVEPYAYGLQTGEQRQEWRLLRNGHGCGTMSASASSFFFRASNPTMADIATGQLKRVTTVSRPGCWINMIPAGGVLLIPEASSGCTCNFSIQCSMAFWPVRATPKSK